MRLGPEGVLGVQEDESLRGEGGVNRWEVEVNIPGRWMKPLNSCCPEWDRHRGGALTEPRMLVRMVL